ncbi:MAG: carbon storage regulator CsrA [Epsilonproteobacteria bacterium]|nr:carbon storage regulator CsrA [Campylobacterota bacterium]
MLVLSRKLGESILLDDKITITVMEVSKGVVRLGIDAPKEMLILRKELREIVKDANIKAAGEMNLAGLSELSKKLKK